ncbi:MAG: hypothetical protein Q8896_09055 [Bacteroidota bacterium]|nr:hypothetical protein [Bacteroidota bacterium]
MNTSHNVTRMASLLALLFTSLLISCSSGNIVSAPTAPKDHTLKIGDSFTYHDYLTDTTGSTIPGTDTTTTAIVTGTGLVVQGRTNVVEINKGTDIIRFVKITDSSFARLQDQISVSDASLPAMWVEFDPAISMKTVIDTTMNCTISGMQATARTIIITKYLGKGSVMLSGQTILTYRFSKEVRVVVNVLGTNYTTTVTATNEYAPSIGYLTQNNAQTMSDSQYSPYPNGTRYSILQSYSLQ